MAETAPATTPSPVAPPPPAVSPVSPAPAPSASAAPAPVLIRSLFINLVFSMFAATVIFAVASYFFLVPRIAIQELHATKLERDIRSLQAQVRDLQASAQAPALAPAPAAALAPAEPAAPAAAAQPAPAAPAAAPAK